ncbi:MAG: DNA recombination/repair protein RecA, partial [Oscillospiraceae bacterium]|nr:DNA recombination/repair protein RecA [Oscillospiraceae bacterium]
SCGEVRLGQGRDNARAYLDAHPELAAEIEEGIRANAQSLVMTKAGGKKTGRALTPAGKGVKVSVDEEIDEED